ncbi:MAG: CHRD domain-containing protein [Cyanobacteria bacterium J06639_1]
MFVPTQIRLGRSLGAIALSTATLFLASCDEEPTLTFPPPRTEANDIELSPENVVPTEPTDSIASGNVTIALTPDEGIRRLVIGGDFANLGSEPIEPNDLPSTRPGVPTPPRLVNIFKSESSPFDESTGTFFATVEVLEQTQDTDPDNPGTLLFSGTFEDTITLQDQGTVDDMLEGQFYISIASQDNPDGELRAQMIFE